MNRNICRRAFSIIEVLIGIFIFTLGLVAIYAILVSTLNINDKNKNSLIASYLAKEQIEMFRSIRDSNYTHLRPWNTYEFRDGDSLKKFEVQKYYTLSPSNDQEKYFIDVQEIDFTGVFPEGESQIENMESYRLCFNESGWYSYDCSDATAKKTPFYRYILIIPFKKEGIVVPGAFEIISKVIWNKKGYHEFDIRTIVTDWRRI